MDAVAVEPGLDPTGGRQGREDEAADLRARRELLFQNFFLSGSEPRRVAPPVISDCPWLAVHHPVSRISQRLRTRAPALAKPVAHPEERKPRAAAGRACHYFVHNSACNQATPSARLPRRQFGRSWTQRVPIMRRHRKLGAERSRANLEMVSKNCAWSCQLVRAAAKPTRCIPAGLRGRGRPSVRTEGSSPAELRAPPKSSETPRARFQARGAFPRGNADGWLARPERPANIGSAWNPVSPIRSKGS